MNKVLHNELLSIIKESHLGIVKGIEFAQAKAPELVRQFLEYHLFYNEIWACIEFIIIVIGVLFIIVGLVAKKTEYEPVIAVMIVITVIYGLCLYSSILNIIKIKTAPSLYLLEYGRSFI